MLSSLSISLALTYTHTRTDTHSDTYTMHTDTNIQCTSPGCSCSAFYSAFIGGSNRSLANNNMKSLPKDIFYGLDSLLEL